jgi:DNA polymerase-1
MFRDLFREIWLVDYEFVSLPGDGERPDPICLVAIDFLSGRKIRLWRDEFGNRPPYSIGNDSLFVAYFASAELGCHLALNWPMPKHVLDLFTEFRAIHNGPPTIGGNGLVGALRQYKLPHIDGAEKKEMQDLANREGIRAERVALLDYCESDVQALVHLLPAMERDITLPYALLRGRYMKAVAHMEFTGVPIDCELLNQLREDWTTIQDRLITKMDTFHVFEGRTCKYDRFEHLLIDLEIPWERLPSGRLNLRDVTFRDNAKTFPVLEPLRQLRHALSKMRLESLAVGADGRNRCLLSPFGARSSRNTPSTTEFIFGPSVWLRSLIKPPSGYGLAYIDWIQQEFGIAAALSGDQAMQRDYATGDAYLAFAKQAGAVPSDATKKTHGPIRALFKTAGLGVLFGMGWATLAFRINQPNIMARYLLRSHQEAYPRFWEWSDNMVNHALLHLWQTTVFGWVRRYVDDPKVPVLRNFPMQANGAEMLRLACCFGTENGIQICAPIHDAVLIMAPLDRLEADAARMRAHMAQASRVVLDGFELQTEVGLILAPNRYSNERGREMFETVMEIL